MSAFLLCFLCGDNTLPWSCHALSISTLLPCQVATLFPSTKSQSTWPVQSLQTFSVFCKSAIKFCMLLQLKVLDVNTNKLTGALPASWSNLSQVRPAFHLTSRATWRIHPVIAGCLGIVTMKPDTVVLQSLVLLILSRIMIAEMMNIGCNCCCYCMVA